MYGLGGGGHARPPPKKGLFQGFLKIQFKICIFSHKRLWAILDFFFTHSRHLTALYPTICKKKITKDPLNNYLLKVKKFHGDGVKNQSFKAKKLEGGGRQTPLPPACLGVMLHALKKFSFCLQALTFSSLFLYNPMLQTLDILNCKF